MNIYWPYFQFGNIGLQRFSISGRGWFDRFSLGYALKDSISNLLAGILILIYRPFGINNKVKVDKNEGTVIHIDLRYTTLENETGKILIPNSKLFTDPITVLK